MIRPRVNLTLLEVAGFFQHPYHMEKCQQYLQLLDDNYCHNLDGHAFSGWIPGSSEFDASAWCYVSRECKDLNGGQEIADKVTPEGHVLKREVSAKICKPGTDRLMRDLSVEDLRTIVVRMRTALPDSTHMLSLGLLCLEAYKALHPWMGVWEAVKPLFAAPTRDALKSLPAPLAKAVEDEEPMVLYVGKPDNHDNYKVVVGKKIYSLDDERVRKFFGLVRTNERICPDTVHCLTQPKHEEL